MEMRVVILYRQENIQHEIVASYISDRFTQPTASNIEKGISKHQNSQVHQTQEQLFRAEAPSNSPGSVRIKPLNLQTIAHSRLEIT
jgi:hypothetical protein